MFRTVAATAALLALTAGPSSAQVTSFRLTGNGGLGLLGSNEAPTPVTGGGSGGLLGAGISFNAATNVLTINTGWGSGHAGAGFINLTGNATIGHLHGPTTNAAPASFGDAAGIRYNLHTEPGWNPSLSNGGFVGVVNILAADVQPLFDGRFYMNVHTTVNGGGEIRGQLVPVPEPGLVFGLAAAGLFGTRALRRQFTIRA